MPTYTPPPTPMTYKAPEQANIGAGIAQLGSQLQQAGTELKRVYDKEQFKQVRAQSIKKLKEQFGAKFQLPLGEQYITPEQFATGMKNLTRGLATYETVKAKSPNRVLPDPGDFATIMFNGSDQDANKVISSLDAMLSEEDKAARDKIASETNAAALAKLGGGTQEERYNKMATSSEVTNTPEKQNEFYAKGAMSQKDIEANKTKLAAIEQRDRDSSRRNKAALARVSAEDKKQITQSINAVRMLVKASGDPDGTVEQTEKMATALERDAERLEARTPGAGQYLKDKANNMRELLYTPEAIISRNQKRDMMANLVATVENDIGMAPTPVPGDTGTGAPKPISAGKTEKVDGKFKMVNGKLTRVQ